MYTILNIKSKKGILICISLGKGKYYVEFGVLVFFFSKFEETIYIETVPQKLQFVNGSVLFLTE